MGYNTSLVAEFDKKFPKFLVGIGEKGVVKVMSKGSESTIKQLRPPLPTDAFHQFQDWRF